MRRKRHWPGDHPEDEWGRPPVPPPMVPSGIITIVMVILIMSCMGQLWG